MIAAIGSFSTHLNLCTQVQMDLYKSVEVVATANFVIYRLIGKIRLYIVDLSNQQEAGTEIEPMGDLNTEAEKKLGRLVREKYVNSTALSCFTNLSFDNNFLCYL